MKKIIKLWLPPIFLIIFKSFNFRGIRFIGKYYSWGEARIKTSGYESEAIFNKVKKAALKVKQGDAACERDSIVFHEPQYVWPTLSCLMHVAASNQGELNVLDFGGSLGSSYFLNKKFLNGLSVEWSVIEQPHFVEFGEDEISDDVLKFYADIEHCYSERKPNCILLSSVLQYLENPYQWLEKFASLDVAFILIDRMPFSKTSNEFIQIQKIPESIYSASYPIHVLNEEKITKFMMKQGFELIESFDSDSGMETKNFYFHGLFYKKL
jgi:putative methyltransferase (TIGR04325 family)